MKSKWEDLPSCENKGPEAVGMQREQGWRPRGKGRGWKGRWGLPGYIKNFGLYSKSSGQPWKHSKVGGTGFVILEIHST